MSKFMPKCLQGDGLRTHFFAAVGAAALTMAVGFNLFFGYGFGWVTGGTAELQKADAVKAAIVAVYTPVCVERYTRNATPEIRAAFLKEQEWSRDSVIEKAGFATPPTFEQPDSEVGDACARAITESLKKVGKSAEKNKS